MTEQDIRDYIGNVKKMFKGPLPQEFEEKMEQVTQKIIKEKLYERNEEFHDETNEEQKVKFDKIIEKCRTIEQMTAPEWVEQLFTSARFDRKGNGIFAVRIVVSVELIDNDYLLHVSASNPYIASLDLDEEKLKMYQEGALTQIERFLQDVKCKVPLADKFIEFLSPNKVFHIFFKMKKFHEN